MFSRKGKKADKARSRQVNVEGPTHSYKPGSAEFVLSLLTGSDQTCPHPYKLVPGRESQVPYRLGFFFNDPPDGRAKDADKWYTPFGGSGVESNFNLVLNIDTSKLCKDCYSEALPEGFVTWSMPYNLAELKRAETYRYGFLPPQYAPGPKGLVPYQQTNKLILKPFHNEVALPATFAYMQHLGRPFYLDVFHLTKPWRKIDDDETDKEWKEAQQLERIELENGLAYESAERILIPDGNGGYGKYSTAEQRIGQDGKNRLAIVPARWDEAPPGEELSEKFSYLPTLSFENYCFPRPSDGDDFNLDAIPLQEALQQQISQQPGLAQSYLSNADRVIEQYYRDNPDGTRWPTCPDKRFKPVTIDDIDSVEKGMRGRISAPGEFEKAKLENEELIRSRWARRHEYPEGDDYTRTLRIRELYKKQGVPERMWPELPPHRKVYDGYGGVDSDDDSEDLNEEESNQEEPNQEEPNQEDSDAEDLDAEDLDSEDLNAENMNEEDPSEEDTGDESSGDEGSGEENSSEEASEQDEGGSSEEPSGGSSEVDLGEFSDEYEGD